MCSFLEYIKSTINKCKWIICVRPASGQNTPRKRSSINCSHEMCAILRPANGQEESIFYETWREFMQYPVLYELSLNYGLPEDEVSNQFESLLQEIEKQLRMKDDAEKLLKEVTSSIVLRNVVYFLKRRNDKLAVLQFKLHELQCEILQNVRKPYLFTIDNKLGCVVESGTLKVHLIGCLGLLAAMAGGNNLKPLERDIRAVIKLDNIMVAQTPWRPCSRHAWNYVCFIEMCYSRIMEIDIFWRGLGSLCAVEFLRLAPFADGMLHNMVLELEPEGLLFAELQLISKKKNERN